jgi:DNA recombination protein Rad52
MFTKEQTDALAAPLDKANVKSRSQAGRELSYVEAWHAIAEANRIFGFDAWDRETVELRQLGEARATTDKYGKEQFRVGYAARVRVRVYAGEHVITREGCGFGSGIDKDPDQAHESALKEAESDAMKRALMTFGNPFGLALYDKTQANVVSGPPPIPVHERGVYVAAKAAIDLCETKFDLDLWAKNNKLSLERIEESDPEVHSALRSHYAKRLQTMAPAQQVAA